MGSCCSNKGGCSKGEKDLLSRNDRLFLSKLAMTFAMAISQKQYVGLANLLKELEDEGKD